MWRGEIGRTHLLYVYLKSNTSIVYWCWMMATRWGSLSDVACEKKIVMCVMDISRWVIENVSRYITPFSKPAWGQCSSTCKAEQQCPIQTRWLYFQFLVRNHMICSFDFSWNSLFRKRQVAWNGFNSTVISMPSTTEVRHCNCNEKCPEYSHGSNILLNN